MQKDNCECSDSMVNAGTVAARYCKGSLLGMLLHIISWVSIISMIADSATSCGCIKSVVSAYKLCLPVHSEKCENQIMHADFSSAYIFCLSMSSREMTYFALKGDRSGLPYKSIGRECDNGEISLEVLTFGSSYWHAWLLSRSLEEQGIQPRAFTYKTDPGNLCLNYTEMDHGLKDGDFICDF
ncbi:hypothetical protein CEXT_454801 [Caerostris extrusa]|uniref:Uncharacterized protein n=1 Tax=Caerostris extrusa TaxID=172846 RepID=A0AAV4Y2B3_CAEEX|nr:hypothetical protein CEXT_454801 [Caerostris extrusa]